MPSPFRGLRLNGTNDDDVLTGGSRDDALSGGRGNDRLFGLEGNDRLHGGADEDNADGGAGSDELKLGSGNDVAVYRMSENTGAHDEYDGGSGHDTLRLEFTASEWASAAVRADVARFLAFLAHHNQAVDDDHGHDGEGGHRFAFAAFGLDVRKFEALRVFVDGVEVDPDEANHAPVLTGANPLNGISEDPTSNPGTAVAALLSGQASDADGAVQGIAVVGVSGTGGHWEYHDGTTWSALAASVGAALILDAAWHVRFVPDLNVQTTTSTTPETEIAEPFLTFHAWDGTSATAGMIVDLSAGGATGGTTAFSAASATSAVAIANVVDAVFTENADAIDLRTFANNSVTDANWFEDLNFLNALGGDDNVFLPNMGSPLFAFYDGFLFTGGDGNDTIAGGDGADWIEGNADDDTISGGDGDDTLAGGLGIDMLDGGIGNDRFLLATATTTEAVDDTMIGGAGDDMLSFDGTNYILASFDSSNPTGTASGSGIESIDLAGARLDGTEDANTFNFSNTTIFFADGGFLAPTVDARGGDDTILAANQDNLVYLGGTGNDTIDGGTGNDFLIGGADDDTISGGDGDDTLAGGLGIDMLDGGIGNDRFLLATATTTEAVDDTMIGGAGDDMLSFDGTNYILASFDSSNPTGTASGSGIEAIDLAGARLDGTEDANTFNFSNTTIFFADGGFLAPTVDARGGDDTIVAANQDNLVYLGGTGNDTIDGGTGNDFLLGGDDNDTIAGGNGIDALFGGLGIDMLDGGDDDDIISILVAGEAIEDTMLGGAGSDLISNETGTTLVLASFDSSNPAGTISGSGIESIALNDTVLEGTGSANAFDFSNTTLFNVLFVDALGGDDTIVASDQDGINYRGGNGNDTITGGDGADWIEGNADDDTISGGDGDDTLAGGLGIDMLDGGIGNDRFLLATATTTEAVDDTMIGGAGDDMLSFDGTNYILASFDSSNPTGTASGSGIESIDLAGARLDGTEDANTFNFSNTTIFFADGGFLAPTVDARGGDDTIVAANQDDLVYLGGTGNDLLVSGTGNDFFIFADGDGDDTIENFTPGIASDDVIDVSDFGFADFAALDASISDVGGNAVIQLDLDDSITLIGVTKSQLAADDFLI